MLGPARNLRLAQKPTRTHEAAGGVEGTPFDFRAPRIIRDQLTRTHEQLRRGNGFGPYAGLFLETQHSQFTEPPRLSLDDSPGRSALRIADDLDFLVD
jgi:hypothetical protein